MKLSEYRETYEYFSGKLSDVARQLAFAGIALVWLFKIDIKPVPKVPGELLLPLALIAIGLLCDLLHYIVATCIWQKFHRTNEKRRRTLSDDEDIEAPWFYPIPINFLFLLKIGCILVGLVLIGVYAARQWFV